MDNRDKSFVSRYLESVAGWIDNGVMASLNPVDTVVYLTIAHDYITYEGAWSPPVRTFAEHVGISMSSVTKSLDKLVSSGLLEKVPGEFDRSPATYKIIPRRSDFSGQQY